MVQCEMCGTETSDPNRVKIEGAELDVCDECTDFGTEVQTQESSTTSTKYSTSSSSGSSDSSTTSANTGTTGGSGGSRGQDIYDDIDELAQDFDQRLRHARESAGLSQEDLANDLNEKASLIRKLEHGDTLPTDDVQRKLETRLDVDLSTGGDTDDTEWSGGDTAGDYTLGDMVERKDS